MTFSSVKTTPITFSLVATYNLYGAPLLGAWRVGGANQYSLIFSNGSYCCTPSIKFSFIIQPKDTSKRNNLSGQVHDKPPQVVPPFVGIFVNTSCT